MNIDEILKEMQECMNEYSLAFNQSTNDRGQCREMIGRLWVYLKLLREETKC